MTECAREWGVGARTQTLSVGNDSVSYVSRQLPKWLIIDGLLPAFTVHT